MTSSPSEIPFVDLQFQHQPIQDQIDQAIQTVVRQGDYVLGQALKEFELEFAQACGTQYGVGVACGTDAIALGLQACGIGKGDEVILPANTFVATLIGVLRNGATPIFVDCDPQTALIDLNAAERAITPKTRAIVPVHLYGQMVSPRRLLELASTYNLVIFEDAAQAHLAEREGYRAGSVGTAAAFSFYPSKNLGAFGDGGMVVTREEIVAQTMRSLRNYGAPSQILPHRLRHKQPFRYVASRCIKNKAALFAGVEWRSPPHCPTVQCAPSTPRQLRYYPSRKPDRRRSRLPSLRSAYYNRLCPRPRCASSRHD